MLIKTDAQTGEITYIPMTVPEAYSKNIVERYSPSSQMDARMIWGKDNRQPVTDVTVTPFSAVVLVVTEFENGATSYGTGFMVSSKTMLTAAHCIYANGLNAKTVKVYLMFNGFKNSMLQTKIVNASSWYVCANFDSNAVTDHEDDYAIVRFNSDVSDSWFGLRVPSNPKDLEECDIMTSGYPKEDKELGEQWYCSGKIDYLVGNYVVTHTADIKKGQSGSPLWSSGNIAEAIVTGTSSKEGKNVARRMTSELYDWLLANGFISR